MYGRTGYATKQEYDRARYLRLKADHLAQQAPDPITALTREERAYIAGLIDGEGSIYITAIGPKRDKTVYPTVAVIMTHEGVIRWLATKLQGQKVHEFNRGALRWKTQKKQFIFRLHGKRAQKLCISIEPYMIVKRDQAQLVISFPCDARIAPGVKIDRSDINMVRFRLRDEMALLNKGACAEGLPA